MGITWERNHPLVTHVAFSIHMWWWSPMMSIFRGIPTHQEDSVALMASFVISRWSPRITIHGLRRMVAANIPRKNYSAISTIFDGKITIFDGKIHYKWSFSIAMLNYQRVFCNNLHPKKHWYQLLSNIPSNLSRLSRWRTSEWVPRRAAWTQPGIFFLWLGW